MTASLHRKRFLAGIAACLFLAAAIVGVVIHSFSGLPERVCGDGQYPVKAATGQGRGCTENGSRPPAGYVTFPPGQTPTTP